MRSQCYLMKIFLNVSLKIYFIIVCKYYWRSQVSFVQHTFSKRIHLLTPIIFNFYMPFFEGTIRYSVVRLSVCLSRSCRSNPQLEDLTTWSLDQHDERKIPNVIQGQTSWSQYHLEKPYKLEQLNTDCTIEVKTINTFLFFSLKGQGSLLTFIS